jgi:hypothetical protein
MILRVLVRSLMIAACLIAWCVATSRPAGAKVKSVGIDSVDHDDRTPYVKRYLPSLRTSPLVMQSRKGNPIVTYRLYLAAGEEHDVTRFRLVNSYRLYFLVYEVNNGVPSGWRLDSSHMWIPFDTSLHAVDPGVVSAYVTADDGEGECQPSNIITFELMPNADQVFEPPVISNIRSPAAGVVVFDIQPFVYSGKGAPIRNISVYRSDGTQVDRSLFKGVGSLFGTYAVADSADLNMRYTNQFVIVGLKAGETSFFVRLQLEHAQIERTSWSHTIASNILTLNVAGTSTKDERLPAVQMNPIISLGVDREPTAATDGVALFPNPADRVVHLRVPAGGRATVRIFGALGDEVLNQEMEITGGIGSLDVSGLANGRYVAVVGSRNRLGRVSFVVMR